MPSIVRRFRLLRPVASVLVALCVFSACAKRDKRATDTGRAESMTDLYGLRQVPTFDLQLSDSDFDALRKAPKDWIKGDFEYQGQRFEKISLRIKGHRSLRSVDEKPAFKLRFNKGKKNVNRRFLGVHRLTLNNLVEDPTMIREYLAYRLAREVGLPVPKAGFANLRVNGTPYGLYLVVETPDENFLERQFGSGAGELYEGEYGCDLFPDDVEGFDLDVGGNDRSALASFAEAATKTGEALPVALWRSPSAPVSLDHLSLFLAFSTYVGDFDGYHHSHNYRIYRNPADDKWQFMSWGLDRAWFKDLAPYTSRGLLAKQCFSQIECRKAYLLAIRRVHAAAQKLDLATGARVISAIIAPDVNADTRRPHNARAIEKARARLSEFLADRERYVSEHTRCLDAAGNEIDKDGDGYGCMDCDDDDPHIHPGASETCDGVDNDCSGLIDEAATCPCPTKNIDGVTYAFCDLRMPWLQAQAQCQSRGGQLAGFGSQEQLAAARAVANETDRERWWLGGSDRDQEGHFRWSDATDISPELWAKGEPDSTGCSQNCVIFSKGSRGRLHDTHCGQHLPFICTVDAR